MSAKVRKQIYIDPEQEESLRRLSDLLGMSEAQLIRQAIDAQTLRLRSRTPPDPNAWKVEREFIRSLIEQGPLEGSRSWRREDAYDR